MRGHRTPQNRSFPVPHAAVQIALRYLDFTVSKRRDQLEYVLIISVHHYDNISAVFECEMTMGFLVWLDNNCFRILMRNRVRECSGVIDRWIVIVVVYHQ